ncbi:MAG: chitinase [Lachnospiraceae bacterium]|nr:chitinase [Lachnospiraceae bacterium]
MKKRYMPVLIAIVMILVIILIGVGSMLLQKLSYSKERADLNEYFGNPGDSGATIILNDEQIEEKALVQDGRVYFSMAFVDEHIDDHFYHDATESYVIFTSATDVLTTTVGSTDINSSEGFRSETYPLTCQSGENIYIAADYLKTLCNYEYTFFRDPNRVFVTTKWGTEQFAEIKKDTQVRVLGGIKSAVVCDVKKGEKVEVKERMDEWSEVITESGFIGYTENKRMSDPEDVTSVSLNEIPRPEYTSMHVDGKVCLVWNNVNNTVANQYATDLLNATQGVNVIAPTWMSLTDGAGNFESLVDPSYVQTMHSRGVMVWATVDNFKYDVVTADVVNVTSRRRALIAGLMNTVLSNGIDGINVDFEYVTKEAAEGYIQFLRELSVECRKNQIYLSADNSHLVNYNIKQQGEVVDYVILMGYDEHVAPGDGVGPCASVEFVRSGIESALERVPSEKVINALPFYSRVWKTTGDVSQTAYGMAEVKQLVAESGASPVWDDLTCSNFVEWTNSDGEGKCVWLEDYDSISVKLSVMSGYNLGGVAGWRLGQETSDIWPLIQSYLAN